MLANADLDLDAWDAQLDGRRADRLVGRYSRACFGGRQGYEEGFGRIEERAFSTVQCESPRSLRRLRLPLRGPFGAKALRRPFPAAAASLRLPFAALLPKALPSARTKPLTHSPRPADATRRYAPRALAPASTSAAREKKQTQPHVLRFPFALSRLLCIVRCTAHFAATV